MEDEEEGISAIRRPTKLYFLPKFLYLDTHSFLIILYIIFERGSRYPNRMRRNGQILYYCDHDRRKLFSL